MHAGPALIALLVVPTLLGSAGFAAETPSETATTESSPAGLQRQIDELRRGQQQLTEELRELRRLLGERSTRADYPARPSFPGVLNLGVKGEPFRGDAKARFAILEYSDFDCSFCSRYAREVFPKLRAEYLDTGKLKYFFGDLPEPQSTNALFKARAARCAEEQNRFWEMHDYLFAHPDDPAGEAVESGAREVGLDREKLAACLSSDRYEEDIRRGATAARRAGLLGTPAFLIGRISENGDLVRATRLVIGAETWEPLRQAIEEVLKAEGAAAPAAAK